MKKLDSSICPIDKVSSSEGGSDGGAEENKVRAASAFMDRSLIQFAVALKANYLRQQREVD